MYLECYYLKSFVIHINRQISQFCLSCILVETIVKLEILKIADSITPNVHYARTTRESTLL